MNLGNNKRDGIPPICIDVHADLVACDVVEALHTLLK
jgi:hypothetical protein